MDKWLDWIQKLEDDLIEQFRGQPKIAVFQKAVARQLDELYAFFYQLYTLQWLDKAEGVQLDGIGNIVDLSRTDALIWANMAGQYIPMEDSLYRFYLWFKIFLNTSDGRYADVARTLKMFWPDTTFFYSEDTGIPATMFFTSEPVALTTDFRILQAVTRVKAAGVALKFIIRADAGQTPTYFAGAVSGFWETTVLDNPDMGGKVLEFSGAGTNVFADSIVFDIPNLGGTVQDSNAAGANIFMEARMED